MNQMNKDERNKRKRSIVQGGWSTSVLCKPSNDLTYPHAQYEKKNLKARTPRNFSWILYGKLCAMAFPEQPENLKFLQDKKVRILISLTKERKPEVGNFPDITVIPIPVTDFTPPTLEQIVRCQHLMHQAFHDNKVVGIHCRQGIGRTGVMVACFLLKHYNLSAVTAIEETRRLRNGLLGSKEQFKAVELYHEHLHSGRDKVETDVKNEDI